jgi:hypothetical protein
VLANQPNTLVPSGSCDTCGAIVGSDTTAISSAWSFRRALMTPVSRTKTDVRIAGYCCSMRLMRGANVTEVTGEAKFAFGDARLNASDVGFVDEFDPHASPIGAKGIGELSTTGVAGAIANAIYDAVGVRVREVPILPHHILE